MEYINYFKASSLQACHYVVLSFKLSYHVNELNLEASNQVKPYSNCSCTTLYASILFIALQASNAASARHNFIKPVIEKFPLVHVTSQLYHGYLSVTCAVQPVNEADIFYLLAASLIFIIVRIIENTMSPALPGKSCLSNNRAVQ